MFDIKYLHKWILHYSFIEVEGSVESWTQSKIFSLTRGRLPLIIFITDGSTYLYFDIHIDILIRGISIIYRSKFIPQLYYGTPCMCIMAVSTARTFLHACEIAPSLRLRVRCAAKTGGASRLRDARCELPDMPGLDRARNQRRLT